jgi:hypothetical protein
MEKKICSNCNKTHPLNNFHKNSQTKDGLSYTCINCVKEKYKNKNEDEKTLLKLKRSAKKRGIELEEVIKEHNTIKEAESLGMKYCYGCLNILDRSCFNKHHVSADGLLSKCKNCNRENSRIYYKKNVDHIANTKKEYLENNRDKIILRQSSYNKKRKGDDPIYHLTSNVRSRIKQFMKIKKYKYKLKTPTMDIVGCSPTKLREHIEKQFTDGMTWDNYGTYGWHLDHIIPLSTAKTREDVFKLNHYTNLQPLWATDNLKKGKKIIN